MYKLLSKMHQRGLDYTRRLHGNLRRKACGGHADVYLGYLCDGMAIAVKRARFMHDGASIRQAISKVSVPVCP